VRYFNQRAPEPVRLAIRASEHCHVPAAGHRRSHAKLFTQPAIARLRPLLQVRGDCDWRQYVVVRQVDGASPQPPQRFTPEKFVAWAKKQTELADEEAADLPE
jgi:hypothetical protein